MAWSTPLTAVSNATLTAVQWNASVRDNLLTTAPALATTSGSHFAATGANAIAERRCSTNTVSTSQTTTSTSYANLATVGPSVTATTGTLALTWATVQAANSTTDANTYWSVDISSATTTAASDNWGGQWEANADQDLRWTATALHTLTAGSNAFTVKYRVDSNTGTFSKRDLVVMPL